MQQFLLLASIAFAAVAAQQPSVTIKNGTVKGVDLPQFNQSIFLGIPYAQPPVGDLRLRPPQSINASFGTLDATAYGPHCWSRFTTGFDDNSGFNNSEDCLTLNVIRPFGVAEQSPVPVLVWIHGGGLTTGGSADFRYNGSFLVEGSIANGKPIVFVSIKALPIDEFRQNSVGTTGVVFDGDFINVNSTFESYKTGKWVKVAFLAGSATDEGRSFGASGANTTDDVKTFIAGSVPAPFIDGILELYPDVPSLGCPFNTGDFQLNPFQNGFFSAPGLQNKRVYSIIGDTSMAAGVRFLAQEVSSQVPFFKFNHIPYSVTFSVEDYVGHFTEVGYVFNTQNNDTAFWLTNHFTATYLGPTAPIADRFLGVYMSRSWASFVATGDPNNANVPSKINWPKYSEGQENMVWQTQGSVIEKDNFRQAGIQFIIDNVFF
ncbi:Carboxylic ester hydrolase [Mycena sanguinolenta]|uniref:Carboxylic ester hydrolase n=1 Tax=Mycena sanguinolenta TaxID=230812 RepID=A0A8H7CJS4_9AGAR|nr:Carboxylic ester hydrolase [Mycena sanguinolenta]